MQSSRTPYTISTKQFTITVRHEYEVPSIYRIGTVEQVEEALHIGALIQQSVKTQRSTDDLRRLTELKDAELTTIRTTYQSQLALLTSEKERITTEYEEKRKEIVSGERESCTKEWEEKLRLLRKDHDALVAKYDTLEVRRRCVEESREKDIQEAVNKTEALMEKLVTAKQDQLNKMEASHARLSESILKQTEEIGKLSSTLGKRHSNVKQKGNDFEEVFGEKLKRNYGVCQGFKSRQTALNGTGHEGDFVTEMEGHHVLWELKEYSGVVPKTEVDKFLRDMRENPNATVGVMISKTTDIFGKNGSGLLHTEFDGRNMLIYINRLEEFLGDDEGRMFQLLLSLFRVWWHYGKEEVSTFDRVEVIRELEKAVEDISKRRTEWKRHKAHLDEIGRWTMDLLDETEARLDRMLKRARNMESVEVGEVTIPDGIFRESTEEKDRIWIGSIMRVAQAGGEMEVRELVDLVSATHKLSKDTIRSNIMAVIKDSAVIKKGIVKWIKGLSKPVEPCLIQMPQ
jgi:hypothetical protein